MTSEFNLSEKIKDKKPLINMACSNLQGQARLDFILSVFDDTEKDVREFIKLLKEKCQCCDVENHTAEWNNANSWFREVIDKLAGEKLNNHRGGRPNGKDEIVPSLTTREQSPRVASGTTSELKEGKATPSTADTSNSRGCGKMFYYKEPYPSRATHNAKCGVKVLCPECLAGEKGK